MDKIMTKLQKDHLMILLESMDNKMQTIVQAVCALNDKIDGFEARLSARIDHVVHIGWVEKYSGDIIPIFNLYCVPRLLSPDYLHRETQHFNAGMELIGIVSPE